ncbi:MAG TPA: hypothetical protein VK752_24230 [Bryobacteraceae bacterium]|jgi:hypothetical protein|nr:hypothetical protein [Bryobacteraceae bacterium]
MKTTDAAEVVNGSKRMKSDNAGSGKTGRSGRVPVRIPQIPMEWMDPMSWRLPSGKALAEFALQAGFLAPLMMGSPRLKKRKIPAPAVNPAVVEKRVKEAPELSGTFRERRF